MLWQWNQDRSGLTKRVVEWSQSQNSTVKSEAMQLAFNAQPKPKEFEPIFRAALKGPNNDLRYRSVQALWEMDPKSLKENLNILIDAVKEIGRNGNWYQAVQALTVIGPDAKQALPALLQALDDPNGQNYAYNLAPAIAHMGPDAVGPLVKNLASTNQQLQSASRQALQMIGPAAAPKLTPLLKDGDSRARIEVLTILGGYGALGKDALPAIVDLIKGADPATRNRALSLLGQVGSDAAEATPDLVKLIVELDKSRTKSNLQTLIQAIGRIGPGAKAASPELKKLLTHAEPSMRAEAAAALLRIDPPSKSDAVPVLLGLMREKKPGINVHLLPDLLLKSGVSAGELMALLRDYVKAQPGTKQSIVMVLNNRPEPVKESAPLLRDLMKDTNLAVRYQAAVALARLGPDGKDAVPELRAMLRQPASSWRNRAAESLANMGSLAQDALPDLLDQWRTAVSVDVKLRLAEPILAIDTGKGKPVLDWLRGQTENLNVTRRITTLRILARHDAKNPDVLKDLLTLARTQHVYYAGLAFDAIGSMGANAKSALPDLRAALKDENLTKRVRTAAALWKIEGKADAVAPVLTAALGETDPITPGAYYSSLPRSGAALAAKALSDIGPAAKSALPALRKANALGDATLRQNATEAIARIEAK